MGNFLCCCLKDDIDLKVSNIYEISMMDIYGKFVDFNSFRGKVLLIVNVACK